MLINKQAPAIDSQAVINNKIQNINWDNFKNKYKVLFFYPLDFTFVCPTEIHAFQENLKEFEKRDAVVIGVSVDSVYAHLSWLKEPKSQGGIEGVTFPLLSDITKNISRAYGVLNEDKGVALRGLFIIDKHNIVQAAQINNLSVGRNINEILRLLDAIEFTEKHGEVCPINWQQGQPGLEQSKKGLENYFENK